MRLALDIGHMGKKSRSGDRGAEYNGYVEADFALEYAVIARKLLEAAGHQTFLLAHDNYVARHAFCNNVKIDLHMQCHVNSPDGRYALIIHSEDAGDNCIAFTEIMSYQLKKWLGSTISKVDVWSIKGDDKRYICLNPGSPSIILEPLFLKNDTHLKFMLHEEGLVMIGKAIAEAVEEWSKRGG